MSRPAATDDTAPARLARHARAHPLRMRGHPARRDGAIAGVRADAPMPGERFAAARCRDRWTGPAFPAVVS